MKLATEQINQLKTIAESFNDEQMSIIFKGISKGLDISSYADTKFNSNQMSAILDGLAMGMDVSVYADAKYQEPQMRTIMEGLKLGLDVSPLLKEEYSLGQANCIFEGIKSGLDVSVYASNEYGSSQMIRILHGMKIGLDVKWYANPAFDHNQMDIIIKALQHGIEFPFDEPSRDFVQYIHDLTNMLEECKCCDEDYMPLIDPVKFYDFYDFRQIDEILKGYTDGVDIRQYMYASNSWEKMREIREQLTLEKDFER